MKTQKISEISSDEDFHNTACSMLRHLTDPKTNPKIRSGILAYIVLLGWYEAGREFRRKTVSKTES